jgi:hypothetical protein
VRQIDVTCSGERLVEPVRPFPARVQGLPDQRTDAVVIGCSHEHVGIPAIDARPGRLASQDSREEVCGSGHGFEVCITN